MEEIAKSISEAIKNAIPCEKENPWTLQVFVQKKSDLSPAYHDIENYFSEQRKASPITQAYLENLKENFAYVSRPGGIFHDREVTNLPFRGGVVQVYAVLYRRIRINNNKTMARRTHLEEIIRISRKFSDQLRACGARLCIFRSDSRTEGLIRARRIANLIFL